MATLSFFIFWSEYFLFFFALSFSGYSAPECVSYGLPSKESDVYTFGMIALEIITGMDFSQEGQSVDGKSSLRFKVSNNHYH